MSRFIVLDNQHDHPPTDLFVYQIRRNMYEGMPSSLHHRVPGFYILHHQNSDRFYVGSTKNIYHRISQHRRSTKASVRDIASQDILAICEHEGGFVFDVFFVPTQDREQAYDYEQLFLNCFMPTGRLFNRATNARSSWLGSRHTDERKEELRQSMLGNKFSLGRKHTEEHKARVSAKLKGIPKSPETVERMRAAQKTTPISVHGIHYSGVREAAKALGISAGLVTRKLKSKSPVHKAWVYLGSDP